MSYHVHQLDGYKHKEFLAQQRIDPVTGQTFRAGDRVVFCGGPCSLAFLEDNWVGFFETVHCEQSDTLSAFPPPRSNQWFSKKKVQHDNSSTNGHPTGTHVHSPFRTPVATPTETPVVPPLSSRPSPIRAFSANTLSIRPGQSVTLNWDVDENYRVSINRGIGSVTNAGFQMITPRVWFWGWPLLINQRRAAYTLAATGPNGTFKKELKIDLTLPALPAAIGHPIPLAPHSVILAAILPLRQQNALLRQETALLDHNRLRTFLSLKQNQIKLSDYVALIMPPRIIRKLSAMPFYQRIPVGFFRRFKHWTHTARV